MFNDQNKDLNDQNKDLNDGIKIQNSFFWINKELFLLKNNHQNINKKGLNLSFKTIVFMELFYYFLLNCYRH